MGEKVTPSIIPIVLAGSWQKASETLFPSNFLFSLLPPFYHSFLPFPLLPSILFLPLPFYLPSYKTQT